MSDKLSERFTVYDIFAIFVPGVVFLYLLVFTANLCSGKQLITWTGTFGDAIILVIMGYATGVFLSGLGELAFKKAWQKTRGGNPTATILLSSDKTFRQTQKDTILNKLQLEFGAIVSQPGSQELINELEEKTYRAYKKVTEKDTQSHRFLAELYGMRAHAFGFLLLILVAISSSFYYKTLTSIQLALVSYSYFFLMVFSLWQMEARGISYARHTLIKYLDA